MFDHFTDLHKTIVSGTASLGLWGFISETAANGFSWPLVPATIAAVGTLVMGFAGMLKELRELGYLKPRPAR